MKNVFLIILIILLSFDFRKGTGSTCVRIKGIELYGCTSLEFQNLNQYLKQKNGLKIEFLDQFHSFSLTSSSKYLRSGVNVNLKDEGAKYNILKARFWVLDCENVLESVSLHETLVIKQSTTKIVYEIALVTGLCLLSTAATHAYSRIQKTIKRKFLFNSVMQRGCF